MGDKRALKPQRYISNVFIEIVSVADTMGTYHDGLFINEKIEDRKVMGGEVPNHIDILLK